MNVDIKFIAKKAGVSPATVSRVLNKTKPVSKDLEEKVMREVEKYNYRPNYLARWLILNKSNLVGIIAPNVSNVFHAEIISNIEETANGLDYNVIVSNVYSSQEKMKNSFYIMRDRKVDGIILLHENEPSQMQELMKLVDVPVVLASANVEGTKLPFVGIDDEQAAFDAVSYLIRLGHQRIAGIFSESYSLGVLRRRGYERAFETAGVPIMPAHIMHLDQGINVECGYGAMEMLFRRTPRPTAVFCVADEFAIGAANYLLDMGYSLPSDMSIVGFDDINLASVIRPKLTTIRQPIAEIGQMAMNMLFELMEGKQLEDPKVIFPHQLVIRESCSKR